MEVGGFFFSANHIGGGNTWSYVSDDYDGPYGEIRVAGTVLDSFVEGSLSCKDSAEKYGIYSACVELMQCPPL